MLVVEDDVALELLFGQLPHVGDGGDVLALVVQDEGLVDELLDSVQYNIMEKAIKMEKDALNYDYYVQDLQKQVERQQILPDQVSLGGSNATLLGYGLIDINIFTRYD